MESITNRALAGELDSVETTGTSIQLMNYSYVNSEDVTPTQGTSKNRYTVNHLTDQNVSIDEINAFRQFRKFNKFKKNLREADENDVCYQCDKKGHFMWNSPRNMLTRGNGGVNQVGKTEVQDLLTSSDSENSTTGEDVLKINYVRNGKFPKKSKYQKYPGKTNRDRINATVETQLEQIACLSKQISDLMGVLASKTSGAEANTARIYTVNFPDDILDINKEAESDIFHFL